MILSGEAKLGFARNLSLASRIPIYGSSLQGENKQDANLFY